jgi:hypothetical protein
MGRESRSMGNESERVDGFCGESGECVEDAEHWGEGAGDHGVVEVSLDSVGWRVRWEVEHGHDGLVQAGKEDCFAGFDGEREGGWVVEEGFGRSRSELSRWSVGDEGGGVGRKCRLVGAEGLGRVEVQQAYQEELEGPICNLSLVFRW